MQPAPAPRTVFLDSGVIIDGCLSEWSAAKALLILTAQHPHHFTVILAEAVDTEIRAAMARRMSQPGVRDLLAAYDGWRSAVQALLAAPIPRGAVTPLAGGLARAQACERSARGGECN